MRFWEECSWILLRCCGAVSQWWWINMMGRKTNQNDGAERSVMRIGEAVDQSVQRVSALDIIVDASSIDEISVEL